MIHMATIAPDIMARAAKGRVRVLRIGWINVRATEPHRRILFSATAKTKVPNNASQLFLRTRRKSWGT